jgi:hypothetical protein
MLSNFDLKLLIGEPQYVGLEELSQVIKPDDDSNYALMMRAQVSCICHDESSRMFIYLLLMYVPNLSLRECEKIGLILRMTPQSMEFQRLEFSMSQHPWVTSRQMQGIIL